MRRRILLMLLLMTGACKPRCCCECVQFAPTAALCFSSKVYTNLLFDFLLHRSYGDTLSGPELPLNRVGALLRNVFAPQRLHFFAANLSACFLLQSRDSSNPKPETFLDLNQKHAPILHISSALPS